MTRLAQVSIPAALFAIAAAAAPLRAAACGAFYGSQVEVGPEQRIVVVHRDGVEAYVFQPRFCGAAAEFGVILPVPAPLSASPALEDEALYDDLDRFTAPTREEVCGMAGGGGCGGSGAGDPPEDPPFGTGVGVLDQGHVGIFEWALLQATSVDAFTGWLGANGFPYDPGATSSYEHYVAASWYFVAFKVSTGASAPGPGERLCGDLGPIRLSFPAARPVVPARIASVNAAGAPALNWRIFVVAPGQQRLPQGGSFLFSLYFAGTLRQAELGSYPRLAAASRDGERLTALDVAFPTGGAPDDLVLEDDPQPRDHRSVQYVSKDCGGSFGCGAGGTPVGLAGVAVTLLLLLRRRRPAGPERFRR